MRIPVSCVVITLNEEDRIARCLEALEGFDEIVVADSGSADRTRQIAESYGAQIVDFTWNGLYPKKKQWCLDNLELKNEWVLLLDADEIMTQALKEEMRGLDFSAAGYFIRGRYIFEGKKLRFGLMNKKLALVDRRKMAYPEIDDLDVSGSYEVEGHYQPQLKDGFNAERIGQLRAALYHAAYENKENWYGRHKKYAAWERGMNRKKAWPRESGRRRTIIKAVFRTLPFRPQIAFLHSFVLKLGFLDGRFGYRFALSRLVYYRMISNASREPESSAARSRQLSGTSGYKD